MKTLRTTGNSASAEHSCWAMGYSLGVHCTTSVGGGVSFGVPSLLTRLPLVSLEIHLGVLGWYLLSDNTRQLSVGVLLSFRSKYFSKNVK